MQESKLIGTLFVVFQQVAVREGRRHRAFFSVRSPSVERDARYRSVKRFYE